KKTPKQQFHIEPTEIAAKALVDKKFLLWSGDPRYSTDLVEWAVPDELLSLSSQTLSDNGIPCVPPSEGLTGIYGQWERAGFVHSLDPVRSHRIFLYPLSLFGLTLQDTVESASTFDHTLRILTPKPRIYMLSLIRYLLDHPITDSSRYHVHNDLLGFISFYILHDTPLNTKDFKFRYTHLLRCRRRRCAQTRFLGLVPCLVDFLRHFPPSFAVSPSKMIILWPA
ncbi:hypothetical protein N7527_007728, partial [Penicillium freii]